MCSVGKLETEAAAMLAGATWISAPYPIPPAHERGAYIFCTTFELENPHEAVLSITAHGIYEAFINGARVGDAELTPGATSYTHTLYVQSYEVTGLLHPGSNEIRVVVSDGWFRGSCGPRHIADNFGTETGLVARLDVTDGNDSVVITSNTSWEVAASEIIRADLMDGQTTDFRRIGQEEWSLAVASTDPVTENMLRLQRSPAPPVRRKEQFTPKLITRLPSGRQIVDFGQNLNGWVQLRKLGAMGTQIELTHGEVLDEAGDLTLANLDYFQGPDQPMIGVGQKDVVVSRGNPTDVFEPRHTTHGFRYVAVDGLTENLEESDLTAIQVRTDLESISTFESGSTDVNNLYRIAVASWKANTCDLPTDCPQRERWGYTGDFQIFVRSAAFLDDIRGFAAKWLHSLADDQKPDGLITNVAPMCGVPPVDPKRPISFDGSAGWGDSSTIIPWELYRQYGQIETLEEFYPMMAAWVRWAAKAAREKRHQSRIEKNTQPLTHEVFLWDAGWHWGEWLEPNTPFDYAKDKAIIATGYLAHSARIVANAAHLLNRLEEETEFMAIANGAIDAWRTEFLVGDGLISEPTQANYVRALSFGLIPSEMEQKAAANLVNLIKENGNRLSTGFLSTGLLLPTLADYGYEDIAYDLLFSREEPGWMVMLDRGGTTIWEAWNGIDKDGNAHDSLDHYSKGAVIAFLHEYAAGIRPLTPGYGEVEIRPYPDSRLGSISASLRTPHGELSSTWTLNGDGFDLTVTIPEGLRATVVLPDGSRHAALAGKQTYQTTLTK